MDAPRLDRGAARDRGRDRRIERPVRGQSGRRTDGRDRDESAGVTLVGTGVQGDGLSDCQGRGAAGRRLHARRTHERHHRRDAGLVRTLDRLCRHQDPALRVREISGVRASPDHVDEVGRRSHGDRAYVCGEPAEGAARAGNRPHRPGRGGDRKLGRSRDGPCVDSSGLGPADPRPAKGYRPGLPAWPYRG